MRSPGVVAVLASLASALPAQQADAPAASGVRLAVPKGHDPSSWVPLVVFWPGAVASAAACSDALTGQGFAVAVIERAPTPDGFAATTAELRRRVRIEQGGMHALVAADAAQATAAVAAVLAEAHEFQTFTACGEAHGVDVAELRRLPRRRVHTIANGDAAAIAAHLRSLHDARQLDGAAAAVARALDSFHDAAAVADEQRYFAILQDDAIFLGTDATERWTGRQFREFATRYFERDSAWTYVALQRAVTIAPGGDLAWFDEALDNQSYGECRGSGVLQLRDGRWVLRQYNLTVPVPNELMRGVARQIRDRRVK